MRAVTHRLHLRGGGWGGGGGEGEGGRGEGEGRGEGGEEGEGGAPPLSMKRLFLVYVISYTCSYM